MKFLETLDYDWIEMLNFHERPFRAKFIPAKVWNDLDNYRNDSRGLINYFKKWRTKIEFRQEKSKAKCYLTYVGIGGEYDPEPRQIGIHIYTDYYDRFPFTEITWDKFKYRLIQIQMHELIHFMQFDRRDGEWSGYVLPYKTVNQRKKNEERKYLSEFDEIQAYAHCIFFDYRNNKPNIPTEVLISRSNKSKADSKNMNYVLRTFNYDYRNNHAIPKIMQQVMKWERKYKKQVRLSRKHK